MSNTSSKRKHTDVQRLLASGLEVVIDPEDASTLYVCIPGPADTPYADGHYWLRTYVVAEYPFKSPSVAFLTPVFHPNVEFDSGSICLDALNEQWTPVITLESIFTTLVPQLLTYPNPDHPFHVYAADILKRSPDVYARTARAVHDMYAREKSGVPVQKIARLSDSELAEMSRNQ